MFEKKNTENLTHNRLERSQTNWDISRDVILKRFCLENVHSRIPSFFKYCW